MRFTILGLAGLAFVSAALAEGTLDEIVVTAQRRVEAPAGRAARDHERSPAPTWPSTACGKPATSRPASRTCCSTRRTAPRHSRRSRCAASPTQDYSQNQSSPIAMYVDEGVQARRRRAGAADL